MFIRNECIGKYNKVPFVNISLYELKMKQYSKTYINLNEW